MYDILCDPTHNTSIFIKMLIRRVNIESRIFCHLYTAKSKRLKKGMKSFFPQPFVVSSVCPFIQLGFISRVYRFMESDMKIHWPKFKVETRRECFKSHFRYTTVVIPFEIVIAVYLLLNIQTERWVGLSTMKLLTRDIRVHSMNLSRMEQFFVNALVSKENDGQEYARSSSADSAVNKKLLASSCS